MAIALYANARNPRVNNSDPREVFLISTKDQNRNNFSNRESTTPGKTAMADFPDYYQLLQVSKNATQAEIKRAFRRLARQYHPDLNRDNPEAEVEFKKICEAYEVLRDANQRYRYDQGTLGDASPFNGSVSKSAYDFYKRGVQKTVLRDYAGAMQDFTQAIHLNPTFQKAYLKRCQARYALGDDRGVLEDCQRVLQMNSKLAEAHYYRGLARYRLGYTQSAIEAYDQTIDLDRQFARAYYQRGLAHQDLQENERAAEDLQQAIALFQAQQDWSGYEMAQTALKKLRRGPLQVLSGSMKGTWGLGGDLGKAVLRFSLNPGGGLLPAYAQLGPSKAVGAGLILGAIAILIITLGASWMLPTAGFNHWGILGVGGVTFGSLVGGSAIARLLTRCPGSWRGDVFIAGATFLPFSVLAVVGAIATSIHPGLFWVCAIFASCYAVLTLYSGWTQIQNCSEQTAAWLVPSLIVSSSWLAYVALTNWVL